MHEFAVLRLELMYTVGAIDDHPQYHGIDRFMVEIVGAHTYGTNGVFSFVISGYEVGDLPVSLQAKLLRFLQERVVERIGGREEIPVDVRVVCATHQDLPARIKSGNFREDLFYRISEITIQIPPLRDREGDVLFLARAFLETNLRQEGKPQRLGFSKSALEALEVYPWPGNIRELQNRIKRSVIMAEGKQITANDLELPESSESSNVYSLREVREQAERKAILRVLGHSGGNLSQAADMLGISRPTMYDLIRRLKLKV